MPGPVVETLDLPSTGNRCHLVHDGQRALVVDPPRDPAVVEAAAEAAGVEIASVADTHVHNDYLSGARLLARRHGAAYLLNAAEPTDVARVGVRDGDVVPVGRLRVRVVDTPGHTPHHQSFHVTVDGDTAPGALFSGGSLLAGSVGRTDLLGPSSTLRLARAQWASAHHLVGGWAEAALLPTHGFGSFCSAGAATEGGDGTVGAQREVNPALLLPREQFVTHLLSSLGPVPAHYAHMASLNRAGADLTPPRPPRRATRDDVTDAVLAGAWVVDLRGRAEFAAGHVPGSVSVERSAQMATYVGWLVPWGDDIVLLADGPDLLAPALRDLAAIGIEPGATHVLDAGAPLTGSYPRATWEDYRAASARGARVVLDVLDVRQHTEWLEGHLPGAVHVPLHELEQRRHELPAGELWVHCRSGYRAGIAASLLHRHGRAVVHVDDDLARAAALALPMVCDPAA